MRRTYVEARAHDVAGASARSMAATLKENSASPEPDRLVDARSMRADGCWLSVGRADRGVVREAHVSAAPERTMLTMERLRRLKWLRPFLLALSRRPYNGPDVPSFRYPQPPSLPVPDDVKRALDEQSED